MESEEAKKKFIMKLGIISLMVLVFVFWILNIKNVFRNNEETSSAQSNQQWQSLKENFNDTFDKMNKSLDKIVATDVRLRAASSSLVDELVAASVSSSSSATSNLPASSSTPVIEADASSTMNNQDCPEYIDCMPTIGEARSCQIPAGCEGKTQIAY